MTEWKERLRGLESLLMKSDPRPDISAYHDMPYAIFRYPPELEFDLRQEISLLQIRLEQSGKQVLKISLAECMQEALEKENFSGESIIDAEKSSGVETTVETIHQILSEYQPLEDLIASRIPSNLDPLRNIVFIVRAGALFPVYRTSSLLEQLKGKVHIPAVLFYPGILDGAAGLRFMGILDAEHNYRPKIF